MKREIGGTCINGAWLDELDPAAGRDDGPVVEECGAMCEVLANASGQIPPASGGNLDRLVGNSVSGEQRKEQ